MIGSKYNICKPDFKEMANLVVDRQDLQKALECMWERGYAAGFTDGDDYAWVLQREEDLKLENADEN